MSTASNRQVDFAKLKDRVSIMQIVEHYGWRDGLKKRGASYVGRCPICGVGKESFGVTPPRAWKCFGDCDEGGNQLDLVAHKEGVSLKEAAVMIADWFGIEDCDREPRGRDGNSRAAQRTNRPQPGTSSTREPARTRRTERTAQPAENKPLGWKQPLQGLDAEHAWLSDRGFMPDTLQEFGVGYCDRGGMMKGYVAIPIFSAGGELLAYAGRDIDKTERIYKFPPAEKFTPGLDLYNLHRALESDRYENEGLVVCVDFFDVMHLFEIGVTHAVALMASAITERQLEKLHELDNPSQRFTILAAHLDQAAGEEIASELTNIGYAHLKVAPLHEALCDMPRDELENWLS